MTEALEKIAKVNKMIVIGGATKNDLWMDIKANVMRVPLSIIKNVDAVTLGAAMLAGNGVGICEKKSKLKTEIIKPNLTKQKIYSALYKKHYSKIYINLKKI